MRHLAEAEVQLALGEEQVMRMKDNSLKRIWLALGLGFFAYLVYRIGWEAMGRDFERLGWFFGLVLLLSGIRYALSSLAWRTAFLRHERPSWRRLFSYRLAGEALNYLSFAGPVLGEPVKASLLREMPFVPALSSTLIETVINGLTASLIIVAGILMLLLARISAPFAAAGTAMTLLGLLVALRHALRRRMRMLTWLWRRLARFRGSRWPKVEEKLSLMEERVELLRRERPYALDAILGLTLLTQVLGLLEIYAVILPLGIVPRLSQVLVMEAMTKAAKAVFFFVPARVGADEGSSIGIFSVLGLVPGAGLTLAVARRLRAVFWSFVGLYVLLASNTPMRSLARTRDQASSPAIRV